MPEPEINLDEFDKDPKHEKARTQFDEMVRRSLARSNAKAEEERKKKEEEQRALTPWPFNLFVK